MLSRFIQFRTLVVLGLSFLLVSAPSRSHSRPSDKIKLEEMVVRHLASIGIDDARAGVRTRIMAGSSQVIFRTVPSGQAIGKAVIASEGSKTLLGMSFPSPVYPREQLGFDGKSFMAAFVTAGNRSALGSFLMTNDVVFKHGLIGGTLSSAWPLLSKVPQGHLEYVGTRRIYDQDAYEIRYTPAGNTDLRIKLFIEQETFRHIRTEYEWVIPAPMGKVEYSNIQEREGRYKMIEDFSLFKEEHGLNLPHIYTIKLSVDTANGTFLAEWTIKLTQFEFNQPIDQSVFTVSAN